MFTAQVHTVTCLCQCDNVPRETLDWCTPWVLAATTAPAPPTSTVYWAGAVPKTCTWCSWTPRALAPACKHLLAARLAQELGREEEERVTEERLEVCLMGL